MAWAVPQHQASTYNKAARQLLSPFSDEEAEANYWQNLEIINNWRSSHSYPLNTFQVTLRGKARSVEQHPIVAQRIKRMDSITAKLNREPDMKLSQMQDIGGCRAVMSTVANVSDMVARYESSRLQHELVKHRDYIARPKTDGYRGVHLVYRYAGKGRYSVYDGLKIEIQLRTRQQHSWATALETVGIFTRQALKWRGGDERWRRFFALVSGAIAAAEGCPGVPEVSEDDEERRNEIVSLCHELDVFHVLPAYRSALKGIEREFNRNASYFLLSIIPSENRVTAEGFAASASQEANNSYTKREAELKSIPGAQAVLIRADSINALQRAYPNYFADTSLFIQFVRQAAGLPPEVRQRVRPA